jgi:hypothetical protein
MNKQSEMPLMNRSFLLDESFYNNSNIRYRGIILDMVESLLTPQRLQDQVLYEIMAPFGFNTLQLSLLTDNGCCLRLDANPRLYHLARLPAGARPLKTEDLQEVVATAKQLGIQVLPEISISTNAGGWYNAGLLVDCPCVLCDEECVGGVANDISQGSLLPLLLSVIQDLHDIFHTSSSDYLHLGRDERRDSMRCWNESGKQEANNYYDVFEERLSYLLKMKGLYDPKHILRWENQEQVQYAKRTGDVTHYHHSIPSYKTVISKNNNHNTRTFFGTVSLTAEKDPWMIYQETRQWAAAQPTGLLAKVEEPLHPQSNHDLAQRLLAFAIGSADDLPAMERTEFETWLATSCRKAQQCQPVEKKYFYTKVDPKSIRKELCSMMTKTLSVPVLRE